MQVVRVGGIRDIQHVFISGFGGRRGDGDTPNPEHEILQPLGLAQAILTVGVHGDAGQLSYAGPSSFWWLGLDPKP